MKKKLQKQKQKSFQHWDSYSDLLTIICMTVYMLFQFEFDIYLTVYCGMLN